MSGKKTNKDGSIDKRRFNGGNKSAGRKTKAEEMGLEARLNKVFEAFTEGYTDVDGADVVLVKLRDIAMDTSHAKHFDALKWFTDRYFGKEPKALIVDSEVTHKGLDVTEILKNAYGVSNDKRDIPSSTNE